jgi:hypothetical protein
MEHRKELEELNKKSLEKLDQYLKSKGTLGDGDSAKLHDAKKEWQDAWNKFREVLIYLEKFEL